MFRPSIDTRIDGYSSQVRYEPHHSGAKTFPERRFALRNSVALQGWRLPRAPPSALMTGCGLTNTNIAVRHAGRTASPWNANHTRRNAADSRASDASRAMTGAAQIAARGTWRTDT